MGFIRFEDLYLSGDREIRVCMMCAFFGYVGVSCFFSGGCVWFFFVLEILLGFGMF